MMDPYSVTAKRNDNTGVFYKIYPGPYFLPPNGASDTNYDQTTITALNTLGNAVAK
jgi:hypothetical protein